MSTPHEPAKTAQEGGSSTSTSAKYLHPNYRHRSGRRGNETARGGNQRNTSSNTTSTRDQGNQMTRRGGKQPQHTANKPVETSASNGPTALPTDQHVPLKGFNATSIQKLLNQGVDLKAAYKPESSGPEPAKSGNPWGAKGEHCNEPMSSTSRLNA
jgi:hypothetical protein